MENTRTLFEAAKSAGVGRIVHFSVTNPSSGSGLPYFRGKAQVEDMLKGLGVPYAIIRPTLVFGVGDLLLNNMAWALRRFPVFPVYGSGDYPVQPVYVEDLAAQAVEAGSQSESSVADAAGPDTFSFEALLRLLASSMGVRRWFPHTPPRVGLALTGLVGLLMRDMALTHDEVVGLMDGLLTSDEPPTGTTRLSDWLDDNADGLGRRYVSELRRNYRGYWSSGRVGQRLAARHGRHCRRPSGPVIIVGWWAGSWGASQSPQPHLEDCSTYYPLRPTRLDEIENLHSTDTIDTQT